MGGFWSSSRGGGAHAGHQHQNLVPEGGIPPSERRVLIALDGSPGSEKAFGFWADAPGSQHDELILYNVLEVPNALTGLLLSQSGTFEYQECETQADLVRQRAEALKRSMLAQCRDRGLRCKFTTEAVTNGSPGSAIVEAAKRMGANVVVVGCRGNNGIRRSILGSVSDYVLQHSTQPIVVVPVTAKSN